MRIERIATGLAASLLLAPGGAAAQEEGVGGDRPAPCSGAEHRQFDFWIGSWEVRNRQGRQVGTNTIERVLGGCALHESWRSAGSHAGSSYNIYDETTGRWHQTWVDNGGLLLRLDGGLRAAAMVLSGERLDGEGKRRIDRITWTPISADSVRQHWEASADGGASWTTVFDGLYVRWE